MDKKRNESVASKKKLTASTFALLKSGEKTKDLTRANYIAEMERGEFPRYIREYFDRLFLRADLKPDHLPLTNLAIDKHLVAPGSALGHFTLLPKGNYLCQMMEFFAKDKLTQYYRPLDLKIPPVLSAHPESIHSLTKRFNQENLNRMVPVGDFASKASPIGRGHFLRYAGDPEVFYLLADKAFQMDQLPLILFSYGDTVRNDFELKGIIRPAGFHQPCHHILTTLDQYLATYLQVHEITSIIMEKLFPLSERFLVIDVEQNFIDSNPEFARNVQDLYNVPIVVKVFKERVHYYSVQHQYYLKLRTGHYFQVANLQVDLVNGLRTDSQGQERFNICYDESDKKHKNNVAIIHGVVPGRNTSALASTLNERMLEIEMGLSPTFPFEFSPYHLRIIPVSPDFFEFAILLTNLLKASFSQDFKVISDNRKVDLRNKIKDAGKDWVPYTMVVGPKEVNSGSFLISNRKGETSIEINNVAKVEDLCVKIGSYFKQTSGSLVGNKRLLEFGSINDPFRSFNNYGHIPDFFR